MSAFTITLMVLTAIIILVYFLFTALAETVEEIASLKKEVKKAWTLVGKRNEEIRLLKERVKLLNERISTTKGYQSMLEESVEHPEISLEEEHDGEVR